jgi:hypothetical protein
MIYQNCRGAEVIAILEPIALFHVWSAYAALSSSFNARALCDASIEIASASICDCALSRER